MDESVLKRSPAIVCRELNSTMIIRTTQHLDDKEHIMFGSLSFANLFYRAEDCTKKIRP